MRPTLRLACGLCVGLAACQSSSGELLGLADAPPLDYAVLVTGGAYLSADGSRSGTFVGPPGVEDQGAGPASDEPIPVSAIVEVLRQGSVFRRVGVDGDDQNRRRVRNQLQEGAVDAGTRRFLQDARDQGFDLLLVLEELQDGPIEGQGINGRWPVTFVTWILLGLGFLIPDHSFESRATLRVTVRELQSGKVLHDPLLVGGPIELALLERSDLLGFVVSIVVPPFWVGNDPESVAEAVRGIVQRRLLLQLARDLKSESVRQRLRERSAASLSLAGSPAAPRVVVLSAESLSVARLRPEGGEPAPAVSAAFEAELLGSARRDGERFRYEAALPEAVLGGRVQVLVGTIRGSVASATFAAERP